MLDVIANEIIGYGPLIITFISISLILFFILFILVSNFKWTKSKVRIFSLFAGFDTSDAICLALIFSRFIFIIYHVFDNENVGLECLIILLISSLVINFLEKDYMGIITSIFISVTIYVIIYLESSLRYFYNYVQHETPILLMVILLGIFTALFGIYTLISSYNHLISLDKKNSSKYESLKNTKRIKWPNSKQNGKLKSLS